MEIFKNMKNHKTLGILLIIISVILIITYISNAPSWAAIDGGWGIGLWTFIVAFYVGGLITYIDPKKF